MTTSTPLQPDTADRLKNYTTPRDTILATARRRLFCSSASNLRSCCVAMRAYLLHLFRPPTCLANRQAFIESRDRLFEPRRPALPYAKHLQRGSKIVLGHRPLQRHPLTGRFLEGRAVGGD